MKKITYILVLLMAIVNASAKDDACFNYIRRSITINEDGNVTEKVSKSLTLYSHLAMNNTYGETFIVYNPQYQTLKIDKAYTIQKDGTKIMVPANALVPCLPSFAAKAPDYNHLTEMVVVHTGLEIGCTIYLDYTLTTKFPFGLDMFEPLDCDEPIKEMTLELNMPTNYKIDYAVFSPKGELKPVKTVKGNTTLAKYSMKNIPLHYKEPLQVTDITKGWYLAMRYNGERNCPTQSSEAIDKYVTELKGKNLSDKQVLDEISNYIKDNFAFSAVPTKYAMFTRDIQRVWQTSYATNIERAKMLLTILKGYGINADIYMSYNPTLPQQYRSMVSAKDIYVVTEIEGKKKYYNASNGNWSSSQPALIDNLKGQEFRNTSIGKPIVKNDTNNVEVKAVEGKDFTTATLWCNGGGCSALDVSNALPTKRWGDVQLNAKADITTVYKVKYDKSLLYKAPFGTTINIKNNAGEFIQTVNKGETENTLVVVRKIKLYKDNYTQKEYQSLREIVNAYKNESTRTLLFVK